MCSKKETSGFTFALFRQVLKAQCVGEAVRNGYLLQKLCLWKFDGASHNIDCFGQCFPTATYTELERDTCLCACCCVCRWHATNSFSLPIYSCSGSQRSLSHSDAISLCLHDLMSNRNLLMIACCSIVKTCKFCNERSRARCGEMTVITRTMCFVEVELGFFYITSSLSSNTLHRWTCIYDDSTIWALRWYTWLCIYRYVWNMRSHS